MYYDYVYGDHAKYETEPIRQSEKQKDQEKYKKNT